MCPGAARNARQHASSEIEDARLQEGRMAEADRGLLRLTFHFETCYDSLRERGYVIYPGKLTAANTFRGGCVGRVDEAEMRGALDAMRAVLKEMGVADGRPG